MIKVFIVDDHDVVRRGLRSFFAELDDIALVGEASNGLAALAEIDELAGENRLPDVVLVDLVMREMDGISTIQALKQRHPIVEVLVVTSFSETQRIHSALAAGAAGYVLKDADVNEIYRAVISLRKGELHLDPTTAGKLADSLAAPRKGIIALSSREREILVLIARGYSNRDIATALGVTTRTIAMHVTSIFSKLNVSSRTQAALWAIREGLVTV